MEQDTVGDLARLLGATARAHHEATGGENPDWARWYAEYMEDRVAPVLGFSPDVDTLEEWLTWADETHRAEAPEERWPRYYAELIVSRIDTGFG